MIKTHTPSSLARYLEKKVKVVFGNPEVSFIGILSQCTATSQFVFVRKGDVFSAEDRYPISMVYPVLYSVKTLEKRQQDFENIYRRDKRYRDKRYIANVNKNFMVCIYANSISIVLETQMIEELMELGYGAVFSPDSLTGYVDLFGYPCVCGDDNV